MVGCKFYVGSIFNTKFFVFKKEERKKGSKHPSLAYPKCWSKMFGIAIFVHSPFGFVLGPSSTVHVPRPTNQHHNVSPFA